MNTYLIPTTAAYCYEPYDYIYFVYADTPQEAYIKACTKLQGEYIPLESQEYELYPFKLYKPDDTDIFPFHESRKYDILTEAFKNTEGAEYMAYFNVNWNDYIEDLIKIADKENWSNDTYPNNKILTNYMVHTYKKLSSEKNVSINNEYALFNTGLFTEFYQPIYAYQDKSKNGLKFLTSYDLGNMNISERPPRANYFDDPSLLLFDWHYEINNNYKHI